MAPRHTKKFNSSLEQSVTDINSFGTDYFQTTTN